MSQTDKGSLIDKSSFLSVLTQAACAISQLSNDRARQKQIISISDAEALITGYGLDGFDAGYIAAKEDAAQEAVGSKGRYERRPDGSWQTWDDACVEVAAAIRKLEPK